MARKQPEIQIVMHWPNTELGWRILLGRIAVFNELKTTQSQDEDLNLNVCIHQITQQDTLDAYGRALECQQKKLER